jgi:hypothetical protein
LVFAGVRATLFSASSITSSNKQDADFM